MKKLIEIARSFSQKLNIGNYETMDFFASAKREVFLGEEESTSKELFEFCKSQVEQDIDAYKKRNEPKPVVMTKEGEEKIEDFREQQKESWNDGEKLPIINE